VTDNHQDQWPKCIHFDLCGGRIYLDPETRTVCAGCETKGLAPATTLPPLPQPYSNRMEQR
jgi:hypothetical protein